jgi:outer membrane protein assembly factor BamB
VLAGRNATAAEHLARGLSTGAADERQWANPGPAKETAVGSMNRPDLSESVEALWQVRFADSVTAGMSTQEQAQWDATPLSAAVPAVAVSGSRLFANYLGYVFAVDLDTGKMLWRSASFHNVEQSAMQNQGRFVEPSRFAILASDGLVWSLVRDLNDQNMLAPFRLVCRRADSGDVVWQTSDLPDYASLDLEGTPLLANGTIYLGARVAMNQRQDEPQQSVLAIRPRDGKLLWKTAIGTLREGQQYYYYGMVDSSPQPRLVYRSGVIYVDTHLGVLARLDADSGELDWGYGYPTDPVQSMRGRIFFFNGMMMQQPTATNGGEPLLNDAMLLFKGQKSDRMVALDPEGRKRLWERPIGRSARLLGSDSDRVYVGGPELGAIDRESRTLLWSTRLPGGSSDARVLVRPDGIWQMTPRGIFELDPATGHVRRIFRGQDTDSDGGNLELADRQLLAVTNRTITAYPTARAAAHAGGGQPSP